MEMNPLKQYKKDLDTRLKEEDERNIIVWPMAN